MMQFYFIRKRMLNKNKKIINWVRSVCWIPIGTCLFFKFYILEFIRKRDQQILDNKHNMYVKKDFAHYDITEDLLRNTLKYDNIKNTIDNRMEHLNSEMYRIEQIKLGYTVKSINNEDSKIILQEIIHRLSKYETLKPFEQNFLHYQWITGGKLNFRQISILYKPKYLLN